MSSFSLWLLLSLSVSVSVCDDTLVKVEQGIIRGLFLTTRTNKTYRAFLGIPYAEPPVGALRFQAPVAPKSWDSIRNATENSDKCYAIGTDSSDTSEDCLYLNVYTPVLRSAVSTKLPVLLWIHGGGFTHGSPPLPDFLIEKDLVIVTITYRLGPFGFLATGDTVIPGNAGLKDQAAAIKWTHKNIHSLGGDSAKITISGQSAGASSIGYQLLYKKNEGLFRAAIIESGSPLNIWSYLDPKSSKEYSFDLARQINSSLDLQNNSALLLEFLVNVDGKLIHEASARTSIKTPLPVTEPEHDSAFLTERQYELLETGQFIRVPTLIGTNSEEEIHQAADPQNLETTLKIYEKNAEKLIPDDFTVKEGINKTKVGAAVRELYFGNVPEDEKLGHVVKFLSHTRFTTSVIKQADLMSNYTDVYFYVFSYDGPMGNVNVTIKGADKIDHAEETKYLFKKSDSDYSNEDLSKFPESDVLTHYRLIEMWSNFVKYLNPTPKPAELLQNLTWPTFTPGVYKYVDIGRNLEIKKKPKTPYYEAWVQFYEDWAKKPFTTF